MTAPDTETRDFSYYHTFFTQAVGGVLKGPGAFLKVQGSSYVRVRDITAVGTGARNPDGTEGIPATAVVVHLASGAYLPFDPCDTAEEAAVMADALVRVLRECGA